ncbi:MAG: tRNA lysidine(34) synthetase TilS [Acidimicrobiia bacterium]|nr:tRNA lysidine(34) synthetase TilS [Acidimicrobiia bacterium]
MSTTELRRRVRSRVPPGTVTIALSGGADSAVVAWALCDLPGVDAVTVDHGLPGSPALVSAATTIAANLGIPHRVVEVHPRSASEGDLRVARLAALEAATEGWIVTGHTADDQAETVFGNLMRGAGPEGLAGIPWRRNRYVRPLLDVSRAETRRLAAAVGLPFVDDPQNDDPTVRRNRIRSETLPSLAATYNPALREALLRTAASAAADHELIEARAAAVPLVRDEEAVLVPAAALTVLPHAVAARVARRALRMLLGPPGGDGAAVGAMIAATAGTRVATVIGGIDVHREGPWLVLVSGAPPSPQPVELVPPATVRVGPWTITAGSGGVAVPVGGVVQVRAARPGDRIAIGVGTKRVTEALREAGVPPRLRARWPVIDERGRIAWVVGVRVAPTPAGGSVVPMSAMKERW